MSRRFIRRLVFLAATLMCSFVATAQSCYHSTRQQGISCYNDGDYNIAIDCFNAAKLCPDKPSSDDLDTWISKCRTKIREKEEAAAAAAAAAEMKRKAYMDIQSVEILNTDENYEVLPFGDASEVRYISPKLSYKGLSGTTQNVTLNIKIFEPDGSLSSGSSSPSGYTYSHTMSVFSGYHNEQLTGWGNSGGGTYAPGTYRYEIWYNGNKLCAKNFTLKGSTGPSRLLVDGEYALSIQVPKNEGYRTFSVSSEGKPYSVTLLPSWCSVTSRTSSSFTIKYAANNTGSSRSDWFRVESGDKQVRVDVTQKGTSAASYLYVDNMTSMSVSFDEEGGYRSFSVRTDGDSYEVTLLPNWCNVTNKTATAFTIYCASNSARSSRTDWFKVRTGAKEVRVDVSQDGNGPTAEIEDIWVDHNYYYGGEKGMMIHLHMSIYGMKGNTGRAIAYFYYGGDSETALTDYNQSYRTTSGKVSVGEDFTPSYDSSEWKDFSIFMPYSELHMASGQHSLKFYVILWDDLDEYMTESDWEYFTYTKN
ncbi:MAG TPA: BACON domain-containing protein [Candidatus Coprenecus pullistercoris]|nr:BACON domain-containing protein [Candidatus Coprenecus pullistercoris]